MSIGLWAQVAVLLMDCYIELLGHVIYRLCISGRAPRTRRLYPIFVRNVGSPDIHKCFRGLTGSQQTPRNLGRHNLVSELRYTNT